MPYPEYPPSQTFLFTKCLQQGDNYSQWIIPWYDPWYDQQGNPHSFILISNLGGITENITILAMIIPTSQLLETSSEPGASLIQGLALSPVPSPVTNFQLPSFSIIGVQLTDWIGPVLVKSTNNGALLDVRMYTMVGTVRTAIVLSPSTGIEGSSFTISGIGFIAYSTVTVMFGDTSLGTCTVGADGSIGASFDVPVEVNAGVYVVSASDGVNSASAQFTVTV